MPEPDTPLSERPWEDVERLLSVDEVLARVLAEFSPLASESVPLIAGRGRVLAEAVVAEDEVPPFRNSAMDGYAVRAIDTFGATREAPRRLRVTGLAAAGTDRLFSVGEGCAVRIMTGAPMPDGADAVVRFEETDEGTRGGRPDRRGAVLVFRAAVPWDNVRPAGEDIARGSVVVETGRILRPADLGLLAAIGRSQVKVHRRPRVAILSTGDEVVPPTESLRPGLIRDSNTTTLTAMAEAWGADVLPLGIAADRLDVLRQHLGRGAGTDLIVTSGGVSLGDFDLVKDALRAEGDISIWQVRMKPGKPLAFGRAGSTPLLGVPGNPVAAAVSFEVFGKPAIRRMLGWPEAGPVTVRTRVIDPIDNRGMRRHYVRAIVEPDGAGGRMARIAGAQGAGVLSSLSRANALLIVPESVERVEPGAALDAILLE